MDQNKVISTVRTMLEAASALLDQLEVQSSAQVPVILPPPDPPQRRNLAQQWSGPLPEANGLANPFSLPSDPALPPETIPISKKGSKPRKSKPKHDDFRRADPFMSAPEADDFEIVYDGDPRVKCSCGTIVAEHPEDNNSPLHNGHKPSVMCDQTRVYWR